MSDIIISHMVLVGEQKILGAATSVGTVLNNTKAVILKGTITFFTSIHHTPNLSGEKILE